MPMMPSPAGVLPFAGIKLAGYIAFAGHLNRVYGRLTFPASEASRKLPSPLTVGISRTALGVAAGALYAFVLGSVDLDLSAIVVFIGLAPLRAAEWALLIWLFFDRGLSYKDVLFKKSVQGTGVSYLLDAPAFGIWFLLPGIPVC